MMPKIQWTSLPRALRQHLFDRLEDRQITAEDLYKLKLWRESEPEAPDGPWYKDFGSFKICGEGKFPKTFLLKGQAARGKPLQVVSGDAFTFRRRSTFFVSRMPLRGPPRVAQWRACPERSRRQSLCIPKARHLITLDVTRNSWYL